MLNYMKADLYRVFGKKSAWIWTLLLLVVPPVMIIGASSQYETEKIMFTLPTVIYFLFFIVSITLTENIFGEDKRLGLYKNDMTSGVSRTELFVAKYLTSVLLEIALWVICSTVCAVSLAHISGYTQTANCFLQMFSFQSVWFILLNVLYLTLFQTIRTLVNKTFVLILVCSAISAVFTQLLDLLKKAFPVLDSLMNIESISTPHVLPLVTMFSALLIGIIALLCVGCYLFKRSDF